MATSRWLSNGRVGRPRLHHGGELDALLHQLAALPPQEPAGREDDGVDVSGRRDLLVGGHDAIAAAYAAMVTGVPGGRVLFLATVVWDAVSTITVARTPKGDYAKALRVLRSRPAPASAH